MVRRLRRQHGDPLVTALLREELEALRESIRASALDPAELAEAVKPRTIAQRVARRAERLLEPRPRPVINATGVVVHTNLGRSVLSAEAARAVAEAAADYLDLEYDLEGGGRGSRTDHLTPLLGRLFPGSDALLVNNNASATLLCLHALAHRKEVIVSRGELVEIGGSFRVPDIMETSGAKLHEVGTTNRTRIADYRKALSKKSGLLLKVHTSNFKIVGFTEETGVEALAQLARESGVPLLVDWGSGDLVDLGAVGIHDEMPVADILQAGADLVCFSGDKLLGGPQAGIVVGRPDLIATLRKDPLARACRLDRLLIAALHATLAAYVRGRAFDEVPTLRMLALDAEAIGKRARKLLTAVRRGLRSAGVARDGWSGELVDGVSKVGGGSSPLGQRPTVLVAWSHRSVPAHAVERGLRAGDPPVVGRVQDDRLLLDLRTVRPDRDAALAQAVVRALTATD